MPQDIPKQEVFEDVPSTVPLLVELDMKIQILAILLQSSGKESGQLFTDFDGLLLLTDKAYNHFTKNGKK